MWGNVLSYVQMLDPEILGWVPRKVLRVVNSGWLAVWAADYYSLLDEYTFCSSREKSV